uniref:universal stress protein UspE n=1 Tax=Thaumasiovibrio occultus TaxID=1891184 RepID=UPI000B360E2D|nr:universal stress protein UspE [Thaumasiovibrio occultus]
MGKFNNILVVVDPESDHQPALSRALHLASLCDDTQITLFLAIYDFSYEMTSMLSADERQAMRHGVIQQREAWLNELVADYVEHGYRINLNVVWHNRPYESIVVEVITNHYDLVIKATHKHDTLGSIIFTPTDWHLLRKCPCPILLVKNQTWPSKSTIVGAVNLATENEEHDALNDKIVKQTKCFAEMLDSEALLLNAYPSTPVNITIELPEFDPASYADAVRGHHLTSMKALRQQHGLPEEQTRVYEGLAEDIIPAVAKEENAELVIMGTTGRTGLSAIFIGNTAEHIIDKLDCDLLALKPDGYISPLDPNINK